MNKELFLNYKEARKEWKDYENQICMISDLLTYCEKCLKSSESIEALRKIKDYYLNLYNNKNVIYGRYKISMHNFQKECNHDIVIQYDNYFRCAICDLEISEKSMNKGVDMISVELFYSVFSLELEQLILEIIDDLILNDKNLVFFFEEEFNKRSVEFTKTIMENHPLVEEEHIYGKVRRIKR